MFGGGDLVYSSNYVMYYHLSASMIAFLLSFDKFNHSAMVDREHEECKWPPKAQPPAPSLPRQGEDSPSTPLTTTDTTESAFSDLSLLVGDSHSTFRFTLSKRRKTFGLVKSDAKVCDTKGATSSDPAKSAQPILLRKVPNESDQAPQHQAVPIEHISS